MSNYNPNRREHALSQLSPRIGELTGQPLMTQTEVAELFRVSSNTVGRWARRGVLQSFRTLGGHKRFRTSEVLVLAGLVSSTAEPEPCPPPLPPGTRSSGIWPTA